MKHKFKVGDRVIGIKNDPIWIDRITVGNIGIITKIDNRLDYPYYVRFEQKVHKHMTDYEYAFDDSVSEDQIELYLTKYKLKKLLKD